MWTSASAFRDLPGARFGRRATRWVGRSVLVFCAKNGRPRTPTCPSLTQEFSCRKFDPFGAHCLYRGFSMSKISPAEQACVPAKCAVPHLAGQPSARPKRGATPWFSSHPIDSKQLTLKKPRLTHLNKGLTSLPKGPHLQNKGLTSTLRAYP
jgi:hypothetical protein